MVLFGAQDEALGPALAEVRAGVDAAGTSPEAPYGDPVAYGRTVGKALRSASEVLEPSWVIGTLPGRAKILSVAFGGLLLIFGVWLGIERGWQSSRVDGPVAVFFPVVAVLVGLAEWGWVQRTRSRQSVAWFAWIGTLARYVGGTWLISRLPDDAVTASANWSMAVIGTVLLVIGIMPPWPKPRDLVDDTGWEDERWFGNAENLLRGRYVFSRPQAVASLRGVRAHRALAGREDSANTEFGNVEIFAAHRAAAHTPAIRRGVRLRHLGWLAVLLGYGGTNLTPKIIEDGLSWLTGCLSLILLWLLIGAIKNLRPSKLDAATAETARRRKTDVLALEPHAFVGADARGPWGWHRPFRNTVVRAFHAGGQAARP